MKKQRLLLALLFFLLSAVVTGQTNYEIRAVNKGGGFIGVEMRITTGPPPNTASFLTDLVFGIKWQNSYNVELVSTITTTYSVVKSDGRKEKNGFYYQAFSAANTPFLFPASWSLNEWVELMSIRNTLTGIGVGTFEITETDFDITTDPNLGVDLIDYRPIVVSSAMGVPLPINLIKFDATVKNKMIYLDWKTTSETNSKGFEVERAETQTNSFKKIGWVSSNDNVVTHTQYEYIDKSIVAGVQYYYRLKQVDKDEKYKYSEARIAMLNVINNQAIRISPNPANKMLQVLFNEEVAAEQVTIKVLDARGAVALQYRYNINPSRNVQLNVSSLSSGHYFLIIENNKEVIYGKNFQKY